MKIAVYAISKNEEQFVERWYNCSKEADYHLIADTGSTDNTVAKAKELGIDVYQISVIPFRFDDARNASLALVPADADYCIALDMDEVLQPGWRQELERAFEEGTDRPQYRFITDWTKEGEPAIEFDGFRIHRRQGVRWKYPIHEVPMTYEGGDVRKRYNFEVHHRPDVTKSRGQYLDLLRRAVDEEPDARNLYYLGRELYFRKAYEDCAKVIKEYIKVSNFPAEKSFALRMLAKCEPEKAEEWLMQATEACQTREATLALANHYYTQKQWKECNAVAKIALTKTERVTGFLSEEWAWGHMADDLIAVSAWQLGNFKEAYKHGKKAVETSPDDERLVNNLAFYKERLNETMLPLQNRKGNKRVQPGQRTKRR